MCGGVVESVHRPTVGRTRFCLATSTSFGQTATNFFSGTESLRTTTWMTIPSRSHGTQAGPCPLRVRQAPWESSTALSRTVRRTRGSFGMTKADPNSFKVSPAVVQSSFVRLG